jgi:hypothetical protein
MNWQFARQRQIKSLGWDTAQHTDTCRMTIPHRISSCTITCNYIYTVPNSTYTSSGYGPFEAAKPSGSRARAPTFHPYLATPSLRATHSLLWELNRLPPLYNLQKTAFCRCMHHLDLGMYAFRTYLSQMQTWGLNRPAETLNQGNNQVILDHPCTMVSYN